jgi:hypothetical protein
MTDDNGSERMPRAGSLKLWRWIFADRELNNGFITAHLGMQPPTIEIRSIDLVKELSVNSRSHLP